MANHWQAFVQRPWEINVSVTYQPVSVTEVSCAFIEVRGHCSTTTKNRSLQTQSLFGQQSLRADLQHSCAKEVDYANCPCLYWDMFPCFNVQKALYFSHTACAAAPLPEPSLLWLVSWPALLWLVNRLGMSRKCAGPEQIMYNLL